VARRRVDPETERVLMLRQSNLTALTKHPSWPELEAEVERKRARIEKLVVTKTLSLSAPVDPAEMAYLRGFVHGMEWFAKVPVSAEQTLERFLKQQGVGVEGVTSE
jgi:hypothetical protein